MVTATVRDRLRGVAEPVDLLRRLRRLGADAPDTVRYEAARLVSQRLWRRWRAELAPFGVGPAAVRTWIQADDRELWLWILGDRPWSQVLDALAGRAARRIEVAASTRSRGSETPAS
jgi:hypothetical protein